MPNSFRWTSVPRSDNDHYRRGGEEGGREGERKVAVRLFSLSLSLCFYMSAVTDKGNISKDKGITCPAGACWFCSDMKPLTVNLCSSRTQSVRSPEHRQSAADRPALSVWKWILINRSCAAKHAVRTQREQQTQSATVTARRVIRCAAGNFSVRRPPIHTWACSDFSRGKCVKPKPGFSSGRCLQPLLSCSNPLLQCRTGFCF